MSEKQRFQEVPNTPLCPDFFGEAEVSTCFRGGEWRKGSFNRFLGYSLRPIHWKTVIFAAY